MEGRVSDHDLHGRAACKSFAICLPTHDVEGQAGGEAHEELDDVVRDEDADLESIVVGRDVGKHVREGIRPLSEPKPMTDEQLTKHMLTH